MSEKRLSDSLRTWVEVKEGAIRSNLASVRRLLGPEQTIMAVVKANAYGHGILEVASLIHRTQNLMLGVDSFDEARVLAKAHVRAPIMILGCIPLSRLREAVSAGFHISLYSKTVLQEFDRIRKKIPFSRIHGHLKIETGTNRLGVRIDELRRIKKLPPFEGAYTHFADAENPASSFYNDQRAVFERTLAYLNTRGIFPRFAHTSATAALLQYPKAPGNLVRLGIGLYGLWPSEAVRRRVGSRVMLSPALAWKTIVAQVKKVPKGETIGYDRTYRARRNMEIAILPVGYYDGFDRAFSNVGEVLVRGRRARVVGNVCMNMIMVDITGINAQAGDVVILIGSDGKKRISAEEVAEIAQTINYELVTRINPLLPRVVL